MTDDEPTKETSGLVKDIDDAQKELEESSKKERQTKETNQSQQPKQTSNQNNAISKILKPEEVPLELKDDFEIISAGERNLEDFKKRKLAELENEEKNLKKSYEYFHAENTVGKTPEQIHEFVSTQQYGKTTNMFKKENNRISLEKHKLSTNPQEYLDQFKRKFEVDKLNYDSNKKYGRFKSDDSFFNNDKLLGEEYVKQLPVISKAQEFKTLYNSNNLSDRKKAQEMLSSDESLREYVKKGLVQGFQKAQNDFLRDDKDIRDLQSMGEPVPEDLSAQRDENLQKLKDSQNAFFNLYPDEKKRIEEDQKKQLDQQKKESNPFERDFEPEGKLNTSGNKILYFSDLHGNLEGLEAVFRRAHQLGLSNVRSIVAGGDLIRGVFPGNKADGAFLDNKADLIKYQKALERLKMIQSMKGTLLYQASPLEWVDENGNVNKRFEGQFEKEDEKLRDDIKNTLEDYAKMYFKAKKNLKLQLEEIKQIAKKYNLLDRLVFVPGNYEGAAPLIEVFGEDRVMGFSNIAEFDRQKNYDLLRNKGKKEEQKTKSFRSKVINAGGLKFFGYGGSMLSTSNWIPSELSEHYGDLNEEMVGRVGMQALGAVIRPIIDLIQEDEQGKKFKEMAKNGTLSPINLKELEDYFGKLAKEKKEFNDAKFKDLLNKFEVNFELILTESHNDARFISDRMSKSKAHIHVSHHPIDSDLGHFDMDGKMTGGVLARNAILSSGSKDDKSYQGFTVGLYGHTHESGVDVLKKDNGKNFYAISTKGLNYDDKNPDDKLGINPIRKNLKGEFAEIDLDENHELSKYTLHKVEGKNSYIAREMTRDDILSRKEKKKEGQMRAFNTLDYDADEYFNRAA